VKPPTVQKTRSGGVVRALVCLLLALGTGAMLALSPDLTVPLVVLLLPGLVTLLIDRSPGLGLARAVLLFQAAAAIGPVQRAFYACAGLHGCMEQLCRPMTVLAVWLAAAAAWALTELVPVGLRVWQDARLRTRRTDLQARRVALVSEWGLDEAPAEPRRG